MKTRIELKEWSGPVAPRFQWRVAIRIEDGALDYEETGARPLGPKHVALTGDAHAALWKDLDAHAVFTRGGELADKTRVGVSFNRLAIARGDESMTLEYTLAQLDDPKNAERKAIVDSIRKAARAAAENV